MILFWACSALTWCRMLDRTVSTHAHQLLICQWEGCSVLAARPYQWQIRMHKRHTIARPRRLETGVLEAFQICSDRVLTLVKK